MDDSKYDYDYDDCEPHNLIDAMNAAIDFRVIQIGQVKHKDKKYDLYRTISSIPLYVINDNGIKIIGIYDTYKEDYEIVK